MDILPSEAFDCVIDGQNVHSFAIGNSRKGSNAKNKNHKYLIFQRF